MAAAPFNENPAIERAKKVRGVFLDVDGVLTDGRITFDASGKECKTFHVRDGFGIRQLMKAGIKVAFITGRTSRAVEMRAQELGIEEVHQAIEDKARVFEEIKATWGITNEEAAYVADDIPDLPIFRQVGLAAAVADASPDIIRYAHMVTEKAGGYGAVREVAEFILRAKGLWCEEASLSREGYEKSFT